MVIARDAYEDLIAFLGLEGLINAPSALAFRHRRHVFPNKAPPAMCCIIKSATDSYKAPFTIWPLPVASRSRSAQDTDHAVGPAHNINDRRSCAQRLPSRARHIGEATHKLNDLVERQAILMARTRNP